MDTLTERQREKLNTLLEMEAENFTLWRRELEDTQATRKKQVQQMGVDLKLRWATLAAVSAELLLVASIAWRISS